MRKSFITLAIVLDLDASRAICYSFQFIILEYRYHRDRSIHIEREGMVGVPEKLRDKLKK